MLSGKPWYFVGYDSYQLPSVAVGAGFNCGGQFSPAWLGQQLDEIASSGATVVRTWFFQSYSADNFVQFDTVLNAAAARGLKIIPVLVNQWGECEPPVGGINDYKTLGWYQGGYKAAGDGYALSFRDYARAMAAHYAGNTTIAFWQLVNEAEAMDSASGPCEEVAAGAAIRSFADDVAGAIKAVDPNHLVSLGTIGTGQCGIAGSDYEYVHSGRIDICEYHDYTAGAITGDPWNGVQPDLDGCAGLHKPTFAGEMGIDASVQANWANGGMVTASSLQTRASFFQAKMLAQFAHGADGFLVWERSTGGPSSGFDVGPGDPLEAVMRQEHATLSVAAARPAQPAGAPTNPRVRGTSVSARRSFGAGSTPYVGPDVGAPSQLASSLFLLAEEKTLGETDIAWPTSWLDFRLR